MTIKYEYKVANSLFVHHFMPGKNLNDIELKSLHRDLVHINNSSKSPVDNTMLAEDMSFEEIKEVFTKTVVCLIKEDNEAVAFLISPIVGDEKTKVVHTGLIIINKNLGANIIALAGTGNTDLAYRNIGNMFVTNISSTPSIVEAFSVFYRDAWPSPKADLRSTPKRKKRVVELLKNNYMDIYFPKNAKIEVDYKRFVLKSESEDMGFDTDMRRLSRANKFEFQSFCHTWISYEKQEDIIQVAEYKLSTYLYVKVLFNLLKLSSSLKTKKAPRKNINQSNDLQKKAA